MSNNIWLPENIKAREWLNNRGIDDNAIVRYSLGYTQGGNVNGLWFGLKHVPDKPSEPERGIVIPHWSERYQTIFALKIRRPVSAKTPNKYYCVSGSKPSISLFNADSLIGKDICFVTEGELDTIALHSKISDLAAVVTLGNKWGRVDDRWSDDLYHIKRFIIVTDCGEDEEAANYWLELVGDKGHRYNLPEKTKDVCEAIEKNIDIRQWAISVIKQKGMSPKNPNWVLI